MIDHGFQGVFQIGPVADAAPFDMVGAGEGDEVGAGDIHKRIAFIVEELLPLADHAEEAVVEDKDLDVDVELHDRAELLQGHLETPITNDGNDYAIRCTVFGDEVVFVVVERCVPGGVEC